MCSVLFECAAPCSITRITDHPPLVTEQIHITILSHSEETSARLTVLYRYCTGTVSRVSRVCPGSPRFLFTGTVYSTGT